MEINEALERKERYLQGTLKNCRPGNFSRREAKTRFPLRFIFQALRRLKNGGASRPAWAPRIFRGVLQSYIEKYRQPEPNISSSVAIAEAMVTGAPNDRLAIGVSAE